MKLQIYEEVAKKHGLSTEVVRQAHSDLWKGIREITASDLGKDVMLTNLGTFTFSKPLLMSAFYRTIHTLDSIERSRLNKNFTWYLYQYNMVAKRLAKIEALCNSIEKRQKRQKGERGL